MITREPGVWSYERNLMKRKDGGETMRDAVSKVNDEINAATTKLIEKIGGAGDIEKVGVQAADVLRQKEREMQEVVGQLYTQAREKFGDKSAGSVPNFLQKLDDPDFVDSVDNASMLDSIYKRLGRFGMLGTSGLPRRDAVMTVGQAESLRKFINQLGNGADPNIQRVRRELIDALDDDVVEGFGDDAFKEARTAARQRFTEFKNTLAGKIGVENKVDAEKVVNKILSSSNKDVRTLKSTLLSGTGDQLARGREVWSGIAAEAVRKMVKDARVGENIINGKTMRNIFNNNMPKFKELLSREDFVTLNRIVRAARDSNMDVDFSSINYSGTAAEIESIFGKQLKETQGGIKNILQQLAVAVTPAGGAGNVVLMAGQQASQKAAANAAAQAELERELLATKPVDVAQQIIQSRMQQAPVAPTQGMRAPGLISSIYAAENPPPEQPEYQGAWQWNPETQSAEWVPFTEAEKAEMRRAR